MFGWAAVCCFGFVIVWRFDFWFVFRQFGLLCLLGVALVRCFVWLFVVFWLTVFVLFVIDFGCLDELVGFTLCLMLVVLVLVTCLFGCF